MKKFVVILVVCSLPCFVFGEDALYLRRRKQRNITPTWVSREDQPEVSVESPLVLDRHVRSLNGEEEQIQSPNFAQTRRRIMKLRRIPQGDSSNWRRRVLRRRKRPGSSVVRVPSDRINVANETEKEKDARFLSLFTLVRFTNDPCETSNGQNGTCYTRSDCTERGGLNEGTCASGFGVCCFFEFECGRTTAENGTYFVNPSSPERICNLMINRLNDDICQIKLDIQTFDIAGPNTDGDCQTDFFLVTGGSQVPQLCGLNNNQHLIYTITSDSGPTQLSMVLDTTVTSSSSRTWNIRVLQYECSSRNLAPVGCLQYFEDTAGEISSFNYKNEVDGTNTNQISNLNYAICIRPANGFCGMRYSQPTSDPYSFTVSGDASASLTFPLPKAGVMYSDTACSEDYIVIPGGSGDGTLLNSRDRYCGITLGVCMDPATGGGSCEKMASPVTTFTRPFVVTVVTNQNEEGEVANRGFRLTFNQQPCLSG